MKIPDIDGATLAAATGGDLAALDRLLVAIQPGVFNLAVRMLGNRDDASDATQEILLKAVTHLASFRRESAFGTWVFRIARNHLLTAITKSREHPEVSLDAMAERLQAGLDYGTALERNGSGEASLTPEDKAAARQVALGCTQNMLMTLDREQRLTWVLDIVFGLSSEQGAQVLGIRSDTYRKRLSRARESLDPFVRTTCGLANREAACRCERQLPAMRRLQADAETTIPIKLVAIGRAEIAEADAHLSALMRMSDAAALFRAHPEYRAPATMVDAIRTVLRSEGYMGSDEPRRLQ